MGLKNYTFFLLLQLFTFSTIAQHTFSVTGIPIKTSGDGLVGYADVTMRPGCMGEPRLQVKIDRIVIQAVQIDGEYINTRIGDQSFPMDIVSGNVDFTGYFQHPSIGVNQKIYIQNGNIQMNLGGFMDWLTISEGNQDVHDMSCPEWKDFASTELRRYLAELEIYNYTCLKASWNNTCLLYELEQLYKKQKKEEAQATAGSSWRDSETDETSEEKEEEESVTEEESEEDESEYESEASSYSSSSSSTSASRSNSPDYSAYYARKQSQNRQNEQLAYSSAAATGTFLYMVGGVVYSNYGKANPEKLFMGKNFFTNFDIGFGLSVHPMYFASEYETPDYDYINKTKGSTSIVFDLNPSFQFGYDTEQYGGYGFVSVSPGISPIFDATQLNFGGGARVFGGLKNVKAFGEFGVGGRNYSASNFLDSQEYGSGKTNYKYNNFKAGIKFSWYGRPTAPARNHISLGIIEEEITSVKEGQSLQRINDYDPYGDNRGYKSTHTGYMFEWRHDHHGILYAQVFPKYPFTGQRGGPNDSEFDNEDGSVFFQVGFLRSFTGFFNM